MIARALLVGMALLAVPPGVGVDALQPRPYFTDVASKSQFSYVTRNDYRSRKYFIQPLAGGVAILDYDNDGRMDIFFTNGAELPSMKKPAAFANALLRNRGNGVDQILQRMPRFGPARLEKAKFYDRGGECARAIAEAQLALSSDGNDINSERAAHILMARCYSLLGHADEAAKEQQWIEAHPNPEAPRKPPPR